MFRTQKVSFHTSKTTLNALFGLNRLSAEVWNTCLNEARMHHLTTRKWINKSDLQKALKKRFPMHSQCVQSVCHRYLRARQGAWEARKAGHTRIRYPYKQKKHFPTRWAKDGFTIHPDGRIELARGIWNGKRQAPLVVRVANLPVGSIKEIELVYDRGLMLALSYEDGKEEAEPTGSHVCSIDPGEIHSLAAVATTGASLIITGRKLRSIKRLRNKKLGELQRRLSKCKKGSRQWKKYHRAKMYLLAKSNRQLTDALHKTTKQFVDWALAQTTKHVTFGDVDGVQRHTSTRRKKKTVSKNQRRSKKHNQRMSQWTFGKLFGYLDYKLAAHGITLAKQDERYTSQTCPVCGLRKKTAGRMYRCRCGYVQHRDIHGAANQLALVQYGAITEHSFAIEKPTYLRIA